MYFHNTCRSFPVAVNFHHCMLLQCCNSILQPQPSTDCLFNIRGQLGYLLSPCRFTASRGVSDYLGKCYPLGVFKISRHSPSSAHLFPQKVLRNNHGASVHTGTLLPIIQLPVLLCIFALSQRQYPAKLRRQNFTKQHRRGSRGAAAERATIVKRAGGAPQSDSEWQTEVYRPTYCTNTWQLPSMFTTRMLQAICGQALTEVIATLTQNTFWSIDAKLERLRIPSFPAGLPQPPSYQVAR